MLMLPFTSASSMPWSSLFAKCTWWCCRVVMGTTIQWTLNTKCFKYWPAWPGLQWNVHAVLCLTFSNPSNKPLQLSSRQSVPALVFHHMKTMLSSQSVTVPNFPQHHYVPFRYGDKNCTCNSERWAHTHSCSVWDPSWSPCRFYKAVLTAGHSQKLFWAEWLSVQWGAGMNR